MNNAAIANKLFYPGDALAHPHKPVEILAFSVAWPWPKLWETSEYAKEIRPDMCFPVHERILKSPGSVHKIPPSILEPLDIAFKVLECATKTQF